MDVACVHCRDYDLGRVRDSVERLLSSPFIAGRVQGREEVLLKVNCLNPHPPERGVTTHPALVRALCDALRERGAKVKVGDSAGGVRGKAHTAQALKASGLAQAALEAGAEVVNFDAQKAVPVTNLRKEGPDPLYLAASLRQGNLVINVPKLKTHLFTGLSAAVKNCYGGLPGAYKHQLHRDYPEVSEFSDVLVDVCLAVAPELCIMDAVWSMEGNGPAMGTLVNTGLLLATTDPFVMDMAACQVVRWPFDSVSTNRQARRRGLMDENQAILVWGDPLQGQNQRPFRRPLSMSLTHRIPGWLLAVAFDWLQPTVVVDDETCTGCGFCVDSCPAQAMSVKHGRATVHRDRCIACYCCVELCRQQSVDLKRRYWVRWQESYGGRTR